MADFLADVGNTRIKWAESAHDGLGRTAGLPLHDHAEWARQLAEWQVAAESAWVLAGTEPEGRDELAVWLRQRGHPVRIVDDHRELPLQVRVEHPEKVGIDRLLNAVAILPKVARGTPVIIVDAGSAVTVDLIDADGAFVGGAILPGYRLMAKALHDYTARLPLVDSFEQVEPPLPGTNTVAAISAGIGFAIHGGVDWIVQRLSRQFGPLKVFLAGGDSAKLVNLDCQPEVVGPYLTLEGLNLAIRNRSR